MTASKGAMTASERADTDAKIRRFCASLVTPGLEKEIRIEAAWRGSSVTLSECRPPWQRGDTAWSTSPFARLTWSSRGWRLQWRRATERWDPYDCPLSKNIGIALAVVHADEYGAFRG